MKNKFYWFAYYLRKKDKSKELRPYMIRDGAAFPEIAHLLYERGYEYNGLLLNKSSKEEDNKNFDFSFLQNNDIIVQSTRPPLTDHLSSPKKRIDRSNIKLEKIIFDNLEAFFEVCSRERIKLTKTVSEHLAFGYENRAEIRFRQTYKNINGSNALYKEFRKNDPRYDWESAHDFAGTAAFFINLKEIYKNGPSLILSFGMGGIETMAWNYLLRKRHEDLLDNNMFAMIELTEISIPNNPMTLDFIDNWKSKIILKYLI